MTLWRCTTGSNGTESVAWVRCQTAYLALRAAERPEALATDRLAIICVEWREALPDGARLIDLTAPDTMPAAPPVPMAILEQYNAGGVGGVDEFSFVSGWNACWQYLHGLRGGASMPAVPDEPREAWFPEPSDKAEDEPGSVGP